MKTKLILKIAGIFAFLLLLPSCNKPDVKETPTPSVKKPATTPPVEKPTLPAEKPVIKPDSTKVAKGVVSAKSQEELDKATTQGNVVVDIHGEAWCAPCRQMTPVIKALSDEMPYVTFVKVNVDDFKPKAGFKGVPTFVFYKDGKEIHRFAGASPKATFKKIVEQKFGL